MTPTLKLSPEQRAAIQSNRGGPVEVEDEQNHSVYVLVARDDFHRLVEKRLRDELQLGFDQIDAGEVDDWDVEEILHAAHGPASKSKKSQS